MGRCDGDEASSETEDGVGGGEEGEDGGGGGGGGGGEGADEEGRGGLTCRVLGLEDYAGEEGFSAGEGDSLDPSGGAVNMYNHKVFH